MQDEKHIEPLDPELIFTNEERELRSEYLVALQKAGSEFAVKYILADASWDEWVKKAKSLGADKIIEIYNAAPARYDGALFIL